MGLLADFFVGTIETARTYNGRSGLPATDFIQSGSITSLEMSTLWAILAKEEWDVDKHDFPMVRSEEGGEVIVQQFPASFVALLASVSPTDLSPAIIDWAATEEMQVDPKEIAPFVAQLQALAQNAVTSERSLFIWNCV